MKNSTACLTQLLWRLLQTLKTQIESHAKRLEWTIFWQSPFEELSFLVSLKHGFKSLFGFKGCRIPCASERAL